jgi:hypothetical protein
MSFKFNTYYLNDPLMKKVVDEDDEEVFKAHHDLSWSSGALNLKLDFVWAPVVNESMIQVSWVRLV